LTPSPASLYWHVASKDDLINPIIDRLTGEIGFPRPTWTAGRSSSRSAGSRLGILGLLRSRDPDRIATFAGDLGALYLGAFTSEESLGLPSLTGKNPPTRSWPGSAAAMSPNRARPVRNVHATLDQLFSGGLDERFELGLAVIIRGLASYIER
jgi:hypothetical protein